MPIYEVPLRNVIISLNYTNDRVHLYERSKLPPHLKIYSSTIYKNGIGLNVPKFLKSNPAYSPNDVQLLSHIWESVENLTVSPIDKQRVLMMIFYIFKSGKVMKYYAKL